MINGDCDKCGALFQCRAIWDWIADTTEDKKITETQIKLLISRFDKLQASFTLTFRGKYDMVKEKNIESDKSS